VSAAQTEAGASPITRLKDGARRLVRGALDPVVALLDRMGVKPDQVTWFGLLVTVAGGVLFGAGHFRLGALVAIVGSLMDSLDGGLARAQNGVTRWGAFLDSTTDRIADAALFLGVAAHYARIPLVMMASDDVTIVLQLGPPGLREQYLEQATANWFIAGAAVVALAGAFLVSYTRARMEGLGSDCRVGWFERPERLAVLLGAGLFGAGSQVMPWALVVLAVLSFFTAFQRVAYARSRLQGSAIGGA
jgi:CDP-diacylglycerol--glycerol-3-phosphate 3-phosphatidyltransferase